jgi:hypothetical protein
MTWRDQLSRAAQDDLDGLLDAVLPFGQTMLAKHGEFFPYGATVTVNGGIQMLAAAGEGERPASNQLLHTLYSAARSTSTATRAAAFVSDVRLGGPASGDAIRVELEHREGVSLVVLLPYRRNRGEVEYGDLSAQSGDRRVWTGDA